jgi:predicted small metal-binding protein
MAKAVSCACGWHARGTEEDLVDALARHVEEAHGERTSREPVASEIEEECGC